MKKLLFATFALAAQFSFGQITLQHTFSSYTYNTQRIKLESSGEKYYTYDDTNKQVILYNANYTIWKTITLPIPTDTTYTVSVLHISDNTINTDNLVEIAYSYYKTTSNPYSITYAGRVVNENGSILLNADNAGGIGVSSIAGLQNKLIVNTTVYEPNTYTYTRSTQVYGLPTTADECCSTSGIVSPNDDNGSINIFPNPTSGHFTITSNVFQGGMVEVYSVTGAKVFSQDVISLAHANINLSQQASGVYLVKVSNGTNTWTQNVVVE